MSHARSDAALRQWVARHPGCTPRLYAATAHNPEVCEGETAISLEGSLTELEPSVPVELLRVGAAAVVLDLASCPEAQAHVNAIIVLAAGLGCADRIRIGAPGAAVTPVPAARLGAVGRRALLGLSAQSSVPLPARESTPHARLRAAARDIAVATDVGHEAGVALRLSAAGCRACGVCPSSCPEQALQLDTEAGQLRYDPSRCSGCSLCLAVCDAQALQSAGALPWSSLLASPVVLEEVALAHCSRCRAPFVPQSSESLCPTCAFRAAHPFGTKIVPGAQQVLDAHPQSRA